MNKNRVNQNRDVQREGMEGRWRKTSRTPAGGSAGDEIRTHNKLHQVVKAGDVEFAYDKSGNMTDDGSRTFEYDAFNRIRTVKRKTDSNLLAEYFYDALGRRIRKTVSNAGLSGDIANGTTDYLYAGNQCIEERDGCDNPTRQFVWGLYIDELIQLREDVSCAPADYYPLQDLLYRTTALTDSTGDIVETYDTDAYGRTLAFASPGPDDQWFTDDDITTSTPRCEYIYTGRQYDPESQLYYYRARYYNPTLGRFMQRDPLGYVDGILLYSYTSDRPTILVDPKGKQAAGCCGPDVTEFLANLINFATAWRRRQGRVRRYEAIRWLWRVGQNLDWWSTAGPYKTDKCPSGKRCTSTYWLAGECVHDHWIGNFMFGLLGRLLGVPDWIMNAAGNRVQAGAEDPPWDTAGYTIGRSLHDKLKSSKTPLILEQAIKEDDSLWLQANNTHVQPSPSPQDIGVWIVDNRPTWPAPHAWGYKDCKKCPDSLPTAVVSGVPGGKYPAGWPNIR